MNEKEHCQLRAVTKLARYMNCWLYSFDPPPDPVRVVWADWVLRGKVPSMERVNQAIAQSELLCKAKGVA